MRQQGASLLASAGDMDPHDLDVAAEAGRSTQAASHVDIALEAAAVALTPFSP